MIQVGVKVSNKLDVAEFDKLADEYLLELDSVLGVTGEKSQYFFEYKIKDLSLFLGNLDFVPKNILDFGSGIGNSIPFFRKYFPDTEITCADISQRSIDIAKARYPGNEFYCKIEESIPLTTDSQDLVFSACVFHHIAHEYHDHWLNELLRVTRPGGLIFIYEHNPYNPLTLRAVKRCKLDVNARLLEPEKLGRTLSLVGWRCIRWEYKLFFPSFLSRLRPAEKFLRSLKFGAQYRIVAEKWG